MAKKAKSCVPGDREPRWNVTFAAVVSTRAQDGDQTGPNDDP